MLKPPTRPRAPSAATLRVLYQLAYISSGTAVGIGALCAEERRRRTQIVQKVADNAKRIRQSPRYAHGAAAVAVKEQEFEDDWTWNDNAAQQQEKHGDENNRRTSRRLEYLDRGRMPELPSVVEEEYGRLVDRNGRKRRKRPRAGRPDFVEEHGQRDHVSRTESDRGRGWQETQLPPNNYSQAQGPTEGLGRNTTKSWDLVSFRRTLRHSTLEDHILACDSRAKLFHATKEGRKYRNPDNSWESTIKPFSTRNHWMEPASIQRGLSPGILIKDVEVFFDKADVNNAVHMNMEHAFKIADHLLQLALSLGAIQEVRSLLMWKVAANVLSAEDIHNIVGAFPTFVARLNPEPALQFYSDLLATAAFESRAPLEKFRLVLKLRAEALKMPASDKFEDPYKRLTDSISIPSKLEHTGVTEVLGRECRELVNQGYLPVAVELWCTTMQAQAYHSAAIDQLDNELFDAALEARHLSLCARILRLRASLNSGRNVRQQKDAFIKVCFEEGATGLVRSLFGSKAEGAIGHNKLSDHSYVCLAKCFAEDDRGFQSFKRYYNRVPPALRTSVAEASVAAGASSLKADWKATRDLDLIQANYQQAIERYAQNDINGQTLRPLHVTMTEIQLSANQPIQAMQSLASMKDSKLDSGIGVLTSLALAKQGDWPTFERLFHALEKDMMDWTPDNKRIFNNALHLFSRHHTAQQLSDLVETAISRLNFGPNKATWEILLSCFVSKKSMSLLRYWLCHPSVQESRIELDANIGGALIKTWYLDFRHSHETVMWFCRELVHKAPSLHGAQICNIVREALGFDLRTLRGTNAPWMESIIRARAALVSQAKGSIPRPGRIWNGQLYDGDKLLQFNQEAEAHPREDDTEEADPSFWEPTETENVRPTEGFAWQDLRPSYESVDCNPSANAETRDVSTLERELILNLSLGQYQTTLQSYQNSLSRSGLPASPIALEVAVEASLRLHKHAEEAERIMAAATDAGMNVTCAVGPLLIHQMRQLSKVDKHTAASLRTKAIDYYRMNERNGLHVKHHIGVHAAYVLIQNGFAEHGLSLLSTIFQSPWSADQPLDITAMSVWFLGYADIGHVQGMHWVLEEIQNRNLSIDMGFIRTLRRARRPTRRRADGSVHYGRQDPKTMAYLKTWTREMRQKRAAQMQASKVFGRKMIDVMAKAANQKKELPFWVVKKIEKKAEASKAIEVDA